RLFTTAQSGHVAPEECRAVAPHRQGPAADQPPLSWQPTLQSEVPVLEVRPTCAAWPFRILAQIQTVHYKQYQSACFHGADWTTEKQSCPFHPSTADAAFHLQIVPHRPGSMDGSQSPLMHSSHAAHFRVPVE